MITTAMRKRAWVSMLTFAATGMLVAGCGGGEQPTPSNSPTSTTTTPTTTSSSSPAPTSGVAPTEKSIDPSGGNLFTPPVQATPAPNIPPGMHHGINGVP